LPTARDCEYADRRCGRTGGPFPERLHLIALVAGFYGELFDLMRRYFGDAADLVETWDATTGVPTDAALRGMLERTLRLIESVAAAR
jgi:PadR family transcriptional regulator AphA